MDKDKGEPPDALSDYDYDEMMVRWKKTELKDKIKNKIKNMKTMEHWDEKTFEQSEVEVDDFHLETIRECKSFLGIKDETTPIMVNKEGNKLFFGLKNDKGSQYTITIEKQ